MRFNDLILIESDIELECYRLDLLESIGTNAKTIKAQAEKILGSRIRGIKAVGCITDPATFSEECDIEIEVYVNSVNDYDEAATIELQQHFDNFVVDDLGAIVVHVFRKP